MRAVVVCGSSIGGMARSRWRVLELDGAGRYNRACVLEERAGRGDLQESLRLCTEVADTQARVRTAGTPRAACRHVCSRCTLRRALSARTAQVLGAAHPDVARTRDNLRGHAANQRHTPLPSAAQRLSH